MVSYVYLRSRNIEWSMKQLWYNFAYNIGSLVDNGKSKKKMLLPLFFSDIFHRNFIQSAKTVFNCEFMTKTH